MKIVAKSLIAWLELIVLDTGSHYKFFKSLQPVRHHVWSPWDHDYDFYDEQWNLYDTIPF